MSESPNILIVMTDGQRRDAIGRSGIDPVFTPHLDAFAREGLTASQVVANSPLCTPSRACFLTGKHPGTLTGEPPQVNMLYNWQRLPVEEETFATAAHRAGYDTALIGKWHLDDWEPGEPGNAWCCFTPPGPRRMGFRFWYSNGCNHNHFDLRYNDTEGRMHEPGEGWQVDHETEVAERYLRNRDNERPADRPFLMWLNWGPPHNQCGGDRPPVPGLGAQYAAPEADEAIYRDPLLPVAHPGADPEAYHKAAPGYFGCVTAVDRAFGRLMATLESEGLAENTIVVFTSDHGEMLSIHGRWIKDIHYEQSIGVPFLIRWPGHVPADARTDTLFGLVDVLPSLLGLAGVPHAGGRHGRDLSSVLLGGDGGGGEPQLLSYNTGAPPPELTRYASEFPLEKGRSWRGLRTPRHTYVVVDQRPESHEKFYDASTFRDAFPPHVTRAAWDLERDPHQMAPIYPGEGHDALLDELHAELKRQLDHYGDDYLETIWSPSRQ